MSFRIRTARIDDLQHLYEMAKLTGGGFTNLPADRGSLTQKLDRSERAYRRDTEEHGDDLFIMVLENVETGTVRGTSQLFTKVGQTWPFYSYRLSTLSQTSKELNRTFSAQMLSLVTDLEGASEVGGLFLHPGERAGGLGLLLARSRYLFIKEHRSRFGEKVFAELRGVIDEAGGSPFWDGHELSGSRLFQRDSRQPVHRRSDAETPHLYGHAERNRPRCDRGPAYQRTGSDADAGE